jgi:ADP-ribosylglycohydrolase
MAGKEARAVVGAIVGDVVGSVYEWDRIKTKDFPLFHPRCTFTDDSVLTVAVAEAILTGRPYTDVLREIGSRYPDAGYGGRFVLWLHVHEMGPYNSWGNGSAMRVSPVGWACDDVDAVLLEARRSAEVTHDHPEGIKGAQATALAIFRARTGRTKEQIRTEIADGFGYDLARTVDDIRPSYRFDESCQRTVPEAIVAFLDSTSYEDAIRNAVSLGGDSDTLACIAGSIAEAYYGEVPAPIRARVREILPADLGETTARFCSTYGVSW